MSTGLLGLAVVSASRLKRGSPASPCVWSISPKRRAQLGIVGDNDNPDGVFASLSGTVIPSGSTTSVVRSMTCPSIARSVAAGLVGGAAEAREPKRLDVKLFTSLLHRLQIRASVMPETELERVPHDGLLDLFPVGRKLVADGGANEVGPVGIEPLLDQQIDVTQAHVAQVDRDLFGVAHFFAKAMNLSGHVHLHPYGWYMDG